MLFICAWMEFAIISISDNMMNIGKHTRQLSNFN